jgi:hypothetical protein
MIGNANRNEKKTRIYLKNAITKINGSYLIRAVALLTKRKFAKRPKLGRFAVENGD